MIEKLQTLSDDELMNIRNFSLKCKEGVKQKHALKEAAVRRQNHMDMLYEIGLLSSNELVEVGRRDLVAKYVGQTAVY